MGARDMTSPLERAARAVEDQFDDTFVELLDPEGPLSSYGLSRAIARAVLTAIREPSVRMIDEGQGAILQRWSRDDGPDVDSAEASWQVMIDAALAEGA